MAKASRRPGPDKLLHQYAALPFLFRDGGLYILLVTSRQSGRWIIPKGWPEKKLLPHEVAAQEAYEEAGLVGQVSPEPLARFRYLKRLGGSKRRHCEVDVFRMAVERELDAWPERTQRQRRWMAPAEAARVVVEAGLAEILSNLPLLASLLAE